MADISQTTWSEVDASNDSTPPDGWPSGTMKPSEVEPAARAIMGAIKRFWNRINATVTAGGSATAYTYTPSNTSFPASYATGEIYAATFSTSNTTTSPTININALGAKNLVDQAGNTLAVGAINGIHLVTYDGTDVRVLNPRSVSGPSSSTVGNVPKFSDTSGNLEDGFAVGTSASNLVQLTSDALLPLVTLGIQGYLSGLSLSNNATTPNTKLDVSSGMCADDTASQVINLSAGVTIDTSTTGALGLDTGTLASSTVYHVFVISKDDGTASALASTSVSTPTLPSGYTKKRRVGSFITDSSTHIRSFSQNGDEFLWNTSSTDIDVTTLTTLSRTLYPLNVPTGIKVMARVRFNGVNSGNSIGIALTSPDESDQGVGGGFFDLIGASGVTVASSKDIRTNTSGQIGVRSNTNNVTSFKLTTAGYIDTRGK